jgi:YfiH family protein
VHGRKVVTTDAGGPWQPPDADAVISDDPSVALVVRVADCAPILMADTRLGVVAAVHAGWRSTMQGIVRAAVESLAASYGSRAGDLIVGIGPSLARCCGEMGEEVVEAFRGAGHDRTSIERWFVREPGHRPHFDLWQANRDQLERAGLHPDHVFVSGICTKTHHTRVHSYRAARQGAGRMVGAIRAS